MAVANSTPIKRPVATKRRHKLVEGLTRYGVGDDALSFRRGLCVQERAAIDRAMEIIGRTLRKPSERFETPAALCQYLVLALAGESRERFAVMYLDSQNSAIAFETLFVGTLNQATVYPREVVMCALKHGASSVVLCHNHPSGQPLPSDADERLTATLDAALRLVDIRVIDHIIVAGNSTYSFAQRGLI